METILGVGVDSLVTVTPDCHVTCDVVGKVAQFRFGGERTSGLTLELSEASLKQVIAQSTDALQVMGSGGCSAGHGTEPDNR